ncbi:hypothetical protein [Xenorhabdus szentirmaii]|uniref:hypothetical protein n=1 Tax=Xenorhabdus szentirmaii TaxID=290112 RepID=UPI0019BFDADA|nr:MULTISPECIES: hypothetical protein [unclassified Xenorhabdus]MBD2791740.1 hypothetical protein [Xenorhabdus sp. CUL]MBD2825341.1 hypothetical protein [Xenorhabdus sp. 5]
MDEMKKKFLEWYNSKYTPIIVNCSEELRETHKHGAWEGYKACFEDMKNSPAVAYLDPYGNAVSAGNFDGGEEEMHETATREGWSALVCLDTNKRA